MWMTGRLKVLPLALVLAASVVSGCGSSTSHEKLGVLRATTATTDTVPVETTTSEAADDPSDSGDGLRTYLDENFGDTSWHDYVTDVDLSGGVADVTTTLVNDSDATEPAGDICAAAASWGKAEHIRVTDPSGVSIAKC
jgi:hypothetical protein